MSDPQFASKVERVLGEPPVGVDFSSLDRAFLCLTQHANGTETLDWLTGKSVAVRLGIGYPGPVIEALVRLGTKIAVQLHARRSSTILLRKKLHELVQTSSNVDAVVMTLKDWVKARDVDGS